MSEENTSFQRFLLIFSLIHMSLLDKVYFQCVHKMYVVNISGPLTVGYFCGRLSTETKIKSTGQQPA